MFPQKSTTGRLTAATRERALAVQREESRAVREHSRCGLSVLGYERDERGDGRFLLGGSWDEALVVKAAVFYVSPSIGWQGD